MLRGHDRMKPDGLRQPHLFEELFQTLPHIVRRGMLRVQLQAEQHTISSVVEC
jgi:hypothetical protein